MNINKYKFVSLFCSGLLSPINQVTQALSRFPNGSIFLNDCWNLTFPFDHEHKESNSLSRTFTLLCLFIATSQSIFTNSHASVCLKGKFL